MPTAHAVAPTRSAIRRTAEAAGHAGGPASATEVDPKPLSMHSLSVGKCALNKQLMDQCAVVAIGHHCQAFSGIQGEPEHGAEAIAHAEVADEADVVDEDSQAGASLLRLHHLIRDRSREKCARPIGERKFDAAEHAANI